jgi:uncharacterized protein YndB with AHSA1/START domain
MPAFSALKNTSAAKFLDVSEFGAGLMVTTDFAKTVEMPKKLSVSDSYQRPVQWVLTSFTSNSGRRTVEHVIIISPFEANQLHADLAKSKAAYLCGAP